MEFIKQNKYIAIGLVALVLIGLYLWFSQKQNTVPALPGPTQGNEPKISQEPTPQQQEPPVVTFHMGGGGQVLRVEIYRDGTYRSYDHDQLTGEGLVTPDEFESIKTIVDSKDDMKDSYCDPNETDQVGYGINILGKRIDLGTCKPECVGDLYGHLAVFQKLLKQK